MQRAGTDRPQIPQRPGPLHRGALVVPMAPKGIEIILGVNPDPAFDPVVMFGLGGIFSELFHDLTFRCAPLTSETARQMIGQFNGTRC